MKRKVRVRFAPSPTGPLHIGGVRTALFNYLFAKKNGGDFILRIEDTDQKRYVEGAENYIIEALKWCNIPFNEGVSIGGDFGPYRQSERKEIYKQYAEKLVTEGNAYYAFDTPEELENMREKLQNIKADVQLYNSLTRGEMINSLTISEAETQERINSGEPYVIRFKMPSNQVVETQDIIRGKVSFKTDVLDDKVLFKSDGMPTYHLANIVDDFLMQITHVIRGEEWLPSLPLHVLLYEKLGWQNAMPAFAHLPLLLKPDGKGKLSKRDGDKMGFPVFPLLWKDNKTGEIASGYRESGYFADAFINMLAFLGWNPGTEKELFSIEELIEAFDLEKAGKSGSKFDPEKAKWYNHQYLQKKDNIELAKLFNDILLEKGFKCQLNTVVKICSLVKERATFVSDFWDQAYYFFIAPTEYDDKLIKKQWKDTTPQILTDYAEFLSKQQDFSAIELENSTKKWLEEKQLGMGKVMTPLRLVLVGSGFGIHLFDIMEIIGKQEVLNRIEIGLQKINN